MSPPAQVSDGPDAPRRENVTLPVAVPAEAGWPSTVAVTVAAAPDATTEAVRILVLEFALATDCVREDDDGAMKALPGYDTETV